MPNPLDQYAPYAQDNGPADVSEASNALDMRSLGNALNMPGADLLLRRLQEQDWASSYATPWLMQLYRGGLAPEWFNRWMQYYQPEAPGVTDWQLLHGQYFPPPDTMDLPPQPSLSTRDFLTRRQWQRADPGDPERGVGVPFWNLPPRTTLGT